MSQDSTISALPSASALTGAEIIPIDQGQTKQTPLSTVKSFVSTGPFDSANITFTQSGASAAGTVAAKLQQIVSVKDAPFNAKGDGVTTDSVAAQAAIDAMSAAGGGYVYFPAGNYKLNIVLKQGVYIVGYGLGDHNSFPSVVQTTFTAAATGVVVDTPAGQTASCGVIGINIVGLGGGTACKGIRFQNVARGIVRDVNLSTLADEGLLIISPSIACYVENILAVQCVLNRTRSSKIGAIDVDGTDHFLSKIESTVSGSIEGHVQSSNLWCVGVMVRGTAMFFDRVIGEISDVGIEVAGNLNGFTNCRGDTNYGHGWRVTGSNNRFGVCLSSSNSQDTTNTYDNFRTESTAAANIFSGCKASNLLANVVKFDFNDLQVGDSGKNAYLGCYGDASSGTAQFSTANSGSGFTFAPGSPKTLTANSTTPSVTGYERFITANSNPTTITNFTGGAEGQLLVILCNDANTTIQHNGTTINTPTGANVALSNQQVYFLVRMQGIWRLNT